ncbi:hypothetical protein [Philodulcilactobacillus myokoensis]|uniref:hypothetical protein n=1 Tax=Philodulcilactobacillus myokoensis TaxID=2929573 RepID=UPI002570A951|nr:hypothetical protein [Philodulcilactobacillus myokoensis]
MNKNIIILIIIGGIIGSISESICLAFENQISGNLSSAITFTVVILYTVFVIRYLKKRS